jgi:anaerobic magnesium-protoporphyrin IX monomethyl ester cyclase
MNVNRVVLIIPNSRWFGKRPWMVLPYAALLLTALLKRRYEFHLLDANGRNLDAAACQDELRQLRPDLVLVTGGSVEYHRQVHQALAIAKSACPEVTTILGGVYPTTLPEEAGKDANADWLFMYHAEDRLLDFLELVVAGRLDAARAFPGIAYRSPQGAVIENPSSQFIGDVQTQVQPDYSQVDLKPYLSQSTLDYQFNATVPNAFIITSYGCPYNCVFCASRTISGRRVAFRSPADVLQEVDYLRERHGVRNLVFLDDALLSDRPRIEAILNAFLERQPGLTWKAASVSAWHLDNSLLELMKRAGCTQLTVSVESGSQRVLRDVIHKPLQLDILPPLLKKCRELGISLGANFVIGLPGETWDEIRQTFAFAEKSDFDVAHFHIATLLPRTDLYRICREHGYLPEGFSFRDPQTFGFGVGHITTEEFTPYELAVLRAFEWDRINFSTPEKLQRVARLYQTSVEALQEHRKQTRRKLGVHF